MEIIKVKDQAAGGKKAFELLQTELAAGAQTLGLATGSTPVTFYEEVVASDLDLSRLDSVNLDEYVGLGVGDAQSYVTFMREHLFDAKPFKENFLPDGKAADLEAEVKRYDGVIAAHPIDFQILGIGQNGHIGFNEPGTPFELTTHVVDLTESTIKANARFFADESQVPRQAISMGIASILKSKHILLLAFGKEKAEAIRAMTEDAVSPALPATVLQRHEQVTVIVDEAAGSLI